MVAHGCGGGDCPDLCGGGRFHLSVRESCRLAAVALRERERERERDGGWPLGVGCFE